MRRIAYRLLESIQVRAGAMADPPPESVGNGSNDRLAATMITTVIVPSYRRPGPLGRCLRALAVQAHAPSEVLVVLRDSDAEGRKVAAHFASNLPVRTVSVSEGGLVAALNQGLDEARGDVIAVTDDDAAPRSDWLRSIVSYFESDPTVGAIGGRDVLHHQQFGKEKRAVVVGRIQWFGRAIGNHHCGTGPAREVDILKGVNMTFRRRALEGIRFDRRLRGSGAQAHNDMAISLALKRRGWRLIYDPRLVVDHYPAERFDEDQRDRFDPGALSNAVHNETLVLLEYLTGFRRGAFVLWSLLVGTRSAPGLLQLVRPTVGDPGIRFARFKAAMSGRWQGFRTWKAWSAAGV